MTGVSVALVGMAWLSRLDVTTPFFPDIVAAARAARPRAWAPRSPRSRARPSRASRADDAGAASGVVNAAQQLGASLGVSILVTVAAGASGASAAPPPTAAASTSTAPHESDLAHAVRAALTGSAVLLALGLAVVAAAVGRFRRATPAPVLEVAR